MPHRVDCMQCISDEFNNFKSSKYSVTPVPLLSYNPAKLSGYSPGRYVTLCPLLHLPCHLHTAIRAFGLYAGNTALVRKCLPALRANAFPTCSGTRSTHPSTAGALTHSAAATRPRALPGRTCTISSGHSKPPILFFFLKPE